MTMQFLFNIYFLLLLASLVMHFEWSYWDKFSKVNNGWELQKVHGGRIKGLLISDKKSGQKS